MSLRSVIPALCLLACLACSKVYAQDNDTARNPHGIHIALAQGLGPAYGVMRDQGVSPRVYQVPGLVADWSAGIQNETWRYTLQLQLSGGMLCTSIFPLENMTSSGADVRATLHIGLERKMLTRNQWQLWVGAAIEDRLAIDYNNRYMNACVGLGNMVAPPLWVTGEYHIKSCTLWLTAGGAPLGGWYRPGFSYVDNYASGETEIEAFSDNHEWGCADLPYLMGGMGVSWRLHNGNALGIAYDWHYLTTRRSGYWIYEGAQHSLRLVFRIAL